MDSTESSLVTVVSRRPAAHGAVVALLVLVAGLVAVGWTGWRARIAQTEAVRSEVLGLARAAALLVDGERHTRLVLPEQTGSLEYRALLAPLVRFHRAVSGFTYLYTMIRQGDVYRFVLDTALEIENDPYGKRLELSPVGSAYLEPDTELVAAFDTGTAQVNEVVHRDAFGVWLSAYAPFHDADGRMIGVVGLDYSLQALGERLARIDRDTLLGGVIVLALALVVGGVMWRARRRTALAEARVEAARERSRHLLEERDRLLTATASSARDLLLSDSPTRGSERALAAIGQAAGVDCVCVFENTRTRDGRLSFSLRQEWTNRGSRLGKPEWQELLYESVAPHWLESFTRGAHVAGPVSELPEPERTWMSESHGSSVLLVPVIVEQELWGFLGFEDHRRARTWSDGEVALLKMAGTIVGGVERLRLAKVAAEAGARAKSRFLATVSHDVRTPIAGVIGMTEYLLATGLDPERERLASNILQCGRGMLQLIDDILDLSRLEAGRMELHPVAFEPSELLRSVADVLQHQVEKKGLALRVEVAPSTPRHLVGDTARIRQVILNLVANAVKFTDRGEIAVHAATQSLPDGIVELTLRVQDTGPGIEPSLLPHLFDAFVRGDESGPHFRPGAGLGLAICHDLTQRMDGRIGVASTLGVGTTFTVSLPLRRADTPAEPARLPGGRPAMTTRPTKHFPGRRVLVADDDPVLRDLAVLLLERLGCTVVAFPDGDAALAALAAEPVEIVLLDLNMPRRDGFATARAIRASGGAGARVPIIAITASSTPTDPERVRAAGFDDILRKPYGAGELGRLLERWLEAQAA